MIGNRYRFGWHKWCWHGGITSGLKKCKRCELVVRYRPEMVCPPMPDPRRRDDGN